MSKIDIDEAEGEGYFASISDLMVGILFVFLLMLTVFALNFRDTEKSAEQEQMVKRHELDLKQKELDEARRQEAEERKAFENASARMREQLHEAVALLQQEASDREQARLRLLDRLGSRLLQQGVKVNVEPNSGLLRLPEELLFARSEFKLGVDNSPAKIQSAQDALTKISDALAEVLPCFTADGAGAHCEPNDRSTLEGVLIEGHSDKQPYRTASEEESREHNDLLSVERALTVFKGISQRNSLDKLKNADGFPLLAVSAYGARRPVPGAGETPEGFQKNRRIDLRFLLSSRTSQEVQTLADKINRELQDTP